MKILTLLGSPRRKGNTATILQIVEQAISTTNEVERINIVDKKISGCIGCDTCQENMNEPACIQEDDMGELIQKMINSDLIIYATPVYVWDFPAQMKSIMDRQYALVKWKNFNDVSLIKRKQVILLTTCGGDEKSNVDLIFEVFDRECNFMQMKVLGKFVVDNCSEPRSLGENASVEAQKVVELILHLNK
jgi:multimeric flavodoxin WrbA